jgi:RNA polymerase sigma-70 factor (ECF subfamily)
MQEDEHFVRDALNGKERGYRKLLEKYRGPVFSHILRMVRNETDAEELAHVAFIRAFRSLAKFNPEYSFKSWIFKIATNLTIDTFRKKDAHLLSLQDLPEEGSYLTVETKTPESELEFKEKKDIIEEAIASLPIPLRTPLLLRHRENLSYEEIQEILNLPLGTVKTRIHRAREMLGKKLRGKDF